VTTKAEVRALLDIYVKAWETQDPDLICTIFTPDAVYHERIMEAPIPDREAIRAYWQSKVVEGQANIECRVLAVYLDGDTVIAEWEAVFDDVRQMVRKRMREVAILTVRGGLFASLREYWASEHLGPLARLVPKPSHRGDTG
jgi:uncharacterized protein (TIGR02246 family)